MKYPQALLEKIGTDFLAMAEKHCEDEKLKDEDFINVMILFHLRSLWNIVHLVANKISIKHAKKLRETMAQRIHAIPLSEKKHND